MASKNNCKDAVNFFLPWKLFDLKINRGLNQRSIVAINPNLLKEDIWGFFIRGIFFVEKKYSRYAKLQKMKAYRKM